MDLAFSPLAAVDFGTLPQQLVNGVLLGAIYALIALGYTMVYGVLKLINFAHGEVYMLGMYIALFVSWGLGFGQDVPPGQAPESGLLNLLIMMLASMVGCAIVGVLIERFAYRPMRSQSRISVLITAIGVSLLLQFGGALFLPNSPPPSIQEKVNPYRDALQVVLKPPSEGLVAEVNTLGTELEGAKAAYDEQLKSEPDEFNLSPAGTELRNKFQEVERRHRNAMDRVRGDTTEIRIPSGQFIMLLTAVGLMILLTYVVLYTPSGRAMRAISHDFDSASLMGINVDRIITFTFIIGSALAGAGAMMQATFLGTPLHTFVGLQPGVKAFVAAVLGGIGNIPGAVVGGLVMGIAETLVVWGGYSSYRDAIAFVVLIVVLLFRPGGILGSAKVEKV
jgi:branched-chain amino acid transport system permease protein